MVKLYAARTLSVNPPDAPFVLSKATLWAALQHKVRRATEFVPAMQDCKVLKDEGDFVVREAVLVDRTGRTRVMREEVTSVGEQWSIFRQADGSVTTNLISYGPEGADGDMQLTYIFEWNMPVQDGSAECDEALASLNEIALMAVNQSIVTARKLVKERVIS